MPTLQDQLKDVSKALAELTKQVDRVADQIKKADPSKATSTKAAPPKKKAAPKKATNKKASAKKTTKKPAGKTSTLLESVYDVIKRSRKGVTVAALKTKTTLNPRQLSNALYKLSKHGRIAAKARGLYVKK